MRFFTVPLLLLAVALCPACADEPASPPTLQDARQIGRQNSRFLKPVGGTQPISPENDSETNPQVAPTADLQTFQQSILSVLQQNCLACHGPGNEEGRLRVDQLNPDLLTGPDVDQWREIYHVLSNSEMPPEDDSTPPLPETDRGMVVEWLSGELNKASITRRNNQQSSSFRRLTKYEYNYALQDLLGLPWSLAEELPPETATEDGFQNSSPLLQMSLQQFQSYRGIALKALRRATVSGPRPQPVTYTISMQQELERLTAASPERVFTVESENYDKERRRVHLFNRETQTGFQFSNAAPQPTHAENSEQPAEDSTTVLVMPRNNEIKLNLDRFLPDEGTMRVSIRASRTTLNKNEYAGLRLSFSAHTSNNANFMNVISERDLPVTAPPESPQHLNFDIALGDIQRNPFRHLETTFPRRDEFLHIRNIANSNGDQDSFRVLIERIEITAPFYEQWPPETHTRIFFDSPNRNDESIYVREVLQRFLERIWRRPITDSDTNPFVQLFSKYRPQFGSLEEAMTEVLATALATPEFLYLTQRDSTADDDSTQRITNFTLASRLAIFLWCSIPDQQLLELAEQNRLHEPSVLHAQVDRMLADPKAERFADQFVRQWLGLDALQNAAHITDPELQQAMQTEPIAYFREALRNNRSVLDFIHSDYALLNERLAAHIGVRDVHGPHFRQVDLQPQQNRGGLLTTAAVLTINSDGQESHPLKRGVWMLERILHDPPPPPPPNVPEVDLTDPKILEMTVKERIADHRNKAACRSCHARIDPWGIAFENFDGRGLFRTHMKNQPVDAAAVLFNGQRLDGVEGLKRYLLLERQDQFAEAMVYKMMAFALGRPLSLSDHAEIEKLTRKFRIENDRLASLVHLITTSPLFQSPQLE
jgi:hypothetical protein